MTPDEPELPNLDPESSEEDLQRRGAESFLPPKREPVVDADDEQGGEADAPAPAKRESFLPPVREPKSEDDEEPEVELAPVPKVPRKEVVIEQAVNPIQSIEDKDWGGATAFKIGWIVSIVVVILALILGSLFFLQKNAPAASDEGSPQDQKRKELVEAINAKLKELVERRVEARDLYADFATSQVVEEILPMVRNSAELQETMRQARHQRLAAKPWKPSPKSQWSLHVYAGKPYARLTGELPDFSAFSAYFVVEEDNLLLDWKATTAYGTASFSELVQGEGDGSEIRGRLRTADLYTPIFSLDVYQCYQFESPDGQNMIWCYAKRTTDAAKMLGRLFGRGEITEGSSADLRLTLQLARGPEGSLRNQWLIEEFLHEEWIQP